MGYYTTFSAPDGEYIEFRRRKPMAARAKQAISRALKGKRKMSGRKKAAIAAGALGAVGLAGLALSRRRKKGGGPNDPPPPPNLKSEAARQILAEQSFAQATKSRGSSTTRPSRGGSLARTVDVTPITNLVVRDRAGRSTPGVLSGKDYRRLTGSRSGSGYALPPARSLPALPASGGALTVYRGGKLARR